MVVCASISIAALTVVKIVKCRRALYFAHSVPVYTNPHEALVINRTRIKSPSSPTCRNKQNSGYMRVVEDYCWLCHNSGRVSWLPLSQEGSSRQLAQQYYINIY